MRNLCNDAPMPCRLCALLFGAATIGGLSAFSLITKRDRVTVRSPPAAASSPGAAVVASTSRNTNVPVHMLRACRGVVSAECCSDGFYLRGTACNRQHEGREAPCSSVGGRASPQEHIRMSLTFSRLDGGWMRQLRNGSPRRVVQHGHFLSITGTRQGSQCICWELRA